MTYSQIVVVIAAFLIPAQLTAQTTERDQLALMIVTKTLNAAGGINLLRGIRDFTGKGTITYYWDSEVRGAVTVKGCGRTRFRLDASLPDGMQSRILNNGTGFVKERDGTIRAVPFPTQLIVFPYTELLDALKESPTSIIYVGLVKHHGRLSHHIRVGHQRGSNMSRPPANSSSIDYFIDPNTFLVSSRRDSAANQSHEIDFGDYRSVDGILAPFSITEKVHGQRLLTINLSEFLLNTNIAVDDFEP